MRNKKYHGLAWLALEGQRASWGDDDPKRGLMSALRY
jgi:hypothetical protein